MAYRNHPTRYLIVKDPGRLGPGPPHSAARREPRVVTPGRPPCQHLFSTSRIAVRVAVALPVSRSGGRFYASPSGPSTLFFNLARFAFASRPVLRFHEAEGLFTRPRSARQHLFSSSRGIILPRTALPAFRRAEERFYASPQTPSTRFFNFRAPRFRAARRAPVSRSGGAIYPTASGPSTPFFKLPGNRLPPDRASGFPSCGGALLRRPDDTVNTFFSIFPRGYAFSQSPVAVFRSGEWLSTWSGPARQVKYCPRFWCSPKHHLFQMFVNHTFPGPTHNA